MGRGDSESGIGEEAVEEDGEPADPQRHPPTGNDKLPSDQEAQSVEDRHQQKNHSGDSVESALSHRF